MLTYLFRLGEQHPVKLVASWSKKEAVILSKRILSLLLWLIMKGKKLTRSFAVSLVMALRRCKERSQMLHLGAVIEERKNVPVNNVMQCCMGRLFVGTGWGQKATLNTILFTSERSRLLALVQYCKNSARTKCQMPYFQKECRVLISVDH